MIKEGQKLPLFKLKNQNGDEIKLPTKEDTVIYFYPKADTPGCTKESCDFQSNLRKFNNLKVKVYGISKDPVNKQSKFADKYKLKFDLLSDENEKICEKFGTWVTKSMYGKTYKGIERSTFLISKGKVIKVWRKVKVNNHVEEVVDTIKLMNK
jgi:peroxiredoxin Q/BCP|tara:strand:- start:1142 stop:1600 length:459 start_codon:yes stop_codon:yes gene_type:complete